MGADQLTAPKTEAEKQAILDQYLADGTITEDDLANETLVEGLTGTYSEGTIPNSAGNNVVNHIEETCGNCLSDSEQLAEEEKQREEESARQAEEALSQIDLFTPEEVEEAQLQAEAEEEAAITYDPSITDEDIIATQSYSQRPTGDIARMIAEMAAPLFASSPATSVTRHAHIRCIHANRRLCDRHFH